jgi:hypothetical protein
LHAGQAGNLALLPQIFGNARDLDAFGVALKKGP